MLRNFTIMIGSLCVVATSAGAETAIERGIPPIE